MRSQLLVPHVPSPGLLGVALFLPQSSPAFAYIAPTCGHLSVPTPAPRESAACPHYLIAIAADTRNDWLASGKALVGLSYTNHQSTCRYSSPRGEAQPCPDAEHSALRLFRR